MTSTQARRIVVFCLALGAVLAAVRALADREMPSPRIAVGAFIAAVALLAVADQAPRLAAGVAVTSLIGGSIAAGPGALDAITHTLNRK